MEQFKAIREKDPGVFSITSIILPVVFCLISGLLLVLWPEPATLVATYVIGGLACVCGLVLVIMYFRSSLEERIGGVRMGAGLIVFFLGVVLVLKPDVVNSLLPKIWGLAMLCGGFLKVQYAFDEKTVHIEKWWILLICAGVSLVIGMLALFVLQAANKQIVGVMLLAESVLDIIVFIGMSKAMKQYYGKQGDLPAQAAEIPDAAEDEPVVYAAEAEPASEDVPAGDGDNDSEIV